MKPRSDLLTEIERASLDSTSDLADVLRKCIALGGQSGSSSLREWASRELKGFGDDASGLPTYRQVPAPLLLDAALVGGHVKGQQVRAMLIPDVAREMLSRPVPITMPVAEIADLVATGRRKGEDVVRLGVPGGAELVALMNHELGQQEHRRLGHDDFASQQIERIYWAVSLSSVQGILDVVRTSLVELVAELRAGMVPGQHVPSADLTEQAFGVAISGNRNRVIVQNVHSASEEPVTVAGGDVLAAEPESAVRRFMWWAVGIATVVAGVAALIAIW